MVSIKQHKKFFIQKFSVQEAFAEIEKEAKETIIASVEGDNARMILSALRKLNTFHSIQFDREKT